MILSVLWSGVVASALGVVLVTHKSRLATQELVRLKLDAAELQVETGQLLLEKSTHAAFARVEQKAINEMNMVVPELEKVVVIKP